MKFIAAMEAVIADTTAPEYEVRAAHANLAQAKADLKNWTPRELITENRETREAAKREVVNTRKASLIAKIEKHMEKYPRLEKALARELKNLSTWVQPEKMDQMIAYTHERHAEEVARAQREEAALRAKLEVMR